MMSPIGTFRTSHGVGDESAMWGKVDIGALLAIPRLWRAGLWGLAQKVATETAEPVKQSITRVLQKVI
jgi:hypothetical protein